ncbi:endonuclease domain-containing protein [Desulfoferrobacter suflitae]|uniref:endonuclease domain-containing protein n=1 Tax=Desulfoferrobacter suflitae TaxID=2865782 RepID=UPI0021647D08|nr:endonuclease domain-containing protein [Desulfoferrobacter suflitae]MCK8601984.1 endonuclease domain-containing protein [Desulfoferrobacter suflitae]
MKEKARALRKNQTDAEKLLWRHLRNRQLAGRKFRRQHPIGPFVADFVCLECGLIVELDGGQHSVQVEKDEARTKYLESNGFKVVRFWNNQVLGEIEAVLTVIRGMLESDLPSP